MIRAFKRDNPVIKFSSVIVVDYDTAEVKSYMVQNSTGLTYSHQSTNLIEDGWEDVNDFVNARCISREEIDYERQREEELNAIIFAGARLMNEMLSLENVSQKERKAGHKKLQDEYNSVCDRATEYGVSCEQAKKRMKLVATGNNILKFPEQYGKSHKRLSEGH